jgi:hypothetical protein
MMIICTDEGREGGMLRIMNATIIEIHDADVADEPPRKVGVVSKCTTISERVEPDENE